MPEDSFELPFAESPEERDTFDWEQVFRQPAREQHESEQ
jgi:hypothetical protein